MKDNKKIKTSNTWAKKSLGQHCRRSQAAIAKVVEAAKLLPADTGLEVGPGEGVLTELLLQKAGLRHTEAGSGLADRKSTRLNSSH